MIQVHKSAKFPISKNHKDLLYDICLKFARTFLLLQRTIANRNSKFKSWPIDIQWIICYLIYICTISYCRKKKKFKFKFLITVYFFRPRKYANFDMVKLKSNISKCNFGIGVLKQFGTITPPYWKWGGSFKKKNSHAEYMPGTYALSIKIIFSPRKP